VRGAIKWAVIVFVLVIVQGQLAGFGHDFPLVAALHGLNALALFGAAIYAARRLRPAAAAGVEQPETRTATPV
jgi:heme A synthase